jgi:hypothetical protein
MPNHREESRFTVRVELSADFADDYEGDDDGFAWLARWQATVRPRLLRAVFEALRSDGGFEAVPVSRGASPEREIEIEVRRVPRDAASSTKPGELDLA